MKMKKHTQNTISSSVCVYVFLLLHYNGAQQNN